MKANSLQPLTLKVNALDKGFYQMQCACADTDFFPLETNKVVRTIEMNCSVIFIAEHSIQS